MSDLKELYAELNTQQKKAVDHTEGPLLVVAGPGTGKTQLLSLRVANILRTADVEPQNILCLTFTESAAYEMRQRLINIVGQKAYNITISTYHAFGSDIISRHSEYFSDLGELKPTNELGAYTIVSDIVQNLPYDHALKKSQYYIKDVISSIGDFKKSTLSPGQVRLIAKDNLRFIQSASDLCKNILASVNRLSKKDIVKFQKLFAQVQKLSYENTLPKGISSLSTRLIDSLETAIEEAGNSNTKPITAWKNAWLERDEFGELVIKGQSTCEKLLALADIYEKYLLELERLGLYDYDDMILRAIVGLQNNKALRYSLQEQYRYILLDEFQDTNAAQLELVTFLTDNPLFEGKPNIMAVGDDDQAIYAFQGADYSHMLAFSRIYQDVKIVVLTENYRSQPEILDSAQKISQQMQERLTNQLEGLDKKLIAKNKSLGKLEISRHEFKSDIAQYAWVANKVSELIKKGTPADSIAILAPKHRYLEPLIGFLRQSKIAVHYDKRENVLDDPQVLQLLRMSQLVVALGDDDHKLANTLWPEVLSYEFFNISVDEIWQLSWHCHKTKMPYTNEVLSNKKLSSIGQFFVRLGFMSKTETLETMIDYLVGVSNLKLPGKKVYQSPYYEHYFGKSGRDNVADFWGLLTNLTVLREHLRRQQSTSAQTTLRDFIDFADAHTQADLQILNTSPYHESGQAVQVMTAYKSKGLEFEHVFLLACIDEVWGSKSRQQNPKISLPDNLSFIRYRGASDDERRRLLFVAITRAKNGLHLLSYTNDFADKPTTRLKYFNEVEEDGVVESGILPEKSQTVIQDDLDAPDAEELHAYWQTRHLHGLKQPKLKSILKPRLDRYQLSPTHLNNFTDVIYGGPEDVLLTTILRFPKAIGLDATFGNLIHNTIEWLNGQLVSKNVLPSAKQAINHYKKLLDREQLSQKDRRLLSLRGEQCLTAFVKQRGKHLHKADLHEFSFKNQGVLVGDAHLNGKIDRLIINKAKKEITIVDYKTGASANKWKVSDPKLHKYKQQLYMYKLLVEGSYQFADYTVSGAYLEFVEPNSKGQITTLAIEFSQTDMQHLKKLIISVWRHIKNMDFPSIDSYPKNIKGILEFENDLIKGDKGEAK